MSCFLAVILWPNSIGDWSVAGANVDIQQNCSSLNFIVWPVEVFSENCIIMLALVLDL